MWCDDYSILNGIKFELANVRLVAFEGHSVGHSVGHIVGNVERLITMYVFWWMSTKYGIFNTA